MSISQSSEMGFGSVRVSTTTNRGHPPEFWVDVVMDRLVHVSDTAPPVIRDQAFAYRDAMREAVDHGIRNAILSHHSTLLYHLDKAGMREAAELIRTARS